MIERGILVKSDDERVISAIVSEFGRFADPTLHTKSGVFSQMLNTIGSAECIVCLNKLAFMHGHFLFSLQGASVQIQDGKNILIIARHSDEWIVIMKKYSYVCAYMAITRIQDDDCRILFPLKEPARHRVDARLLKRYLAAKIKIQHKG